MLIDGAARVACVTPARRVVGRSVTTIQGLDDPTRERWANAFLDCGASQCGFCTPGIILRLVALERRDGRLPADPDAVRTSLLAHLCRCTGWQTIVEAAATAAAAGAGRAAAGTTATRDSFLSAWRAGIEGGTLQAAGRNEILGGGGFADDRAPLGAKVAVPARSGGYVAAESRSAARTLVHWPPGRRSTVALSYPVEVPGGPWAVTLRTTWVEPAYLELDASWCVPGASPASPLANGGAFGGKQHSTAPQAARELADTLGEPARVVWSREDVVRRGPKRPPIAAGLDLEGVGVIRIARTPGSDVTGCAEAMAAVLPRADIEVIEVAGPPVSADPRAAGWAEAQVLLAGIRHRSEAAGTEAGTSGDLVAAAVAEISGGDGARARVTLSPESTNSHGDSKAGWGSVRADVWAGEILDPVTLRSYVIGAVHQGLGWTWQEAIGVDQSGLPVDLTIRSFGILNPRQMPEVDVKLHSSEDWPVRAGDAVFAAAAAAAWIAQGLPTDWPTRRKMR